MENISRRKYLNLLANAGIGTLIGSSFFSQTKSIRSVASTEAFSRFIPNDAYKKITAFQKTEGIQYFNFSPHGGWILISKKNEVVSKSLPKGCEAKVKSYLAKGHAINSISFPKNTTKGYLIITNKTKFARFIPKKINTELNRLISKNHKIEFVALPPKASTDSYLILTNKGYSAHKISDECFQMIKNLRQKPRGTGSAPRKIHYVGFDYKGGWVILADDYYFEKNIHSDCKTRLRQFKNRKRQTDLIAFSPSRNGFTMISNTSFRNPPTDEIRAFENNFSRNGTRQTIWQQMAAYNTPGVSVAVVIDNRIAWSCAYGVLNKDKSPAVHPNSLWQAASISKVVAAVSAMCLVEEGRMGLQDDIRNLLSSWNLKVASSLSSAVRMRPPTLERILSHTAGINVSGFGGYAASTTNLPNLLKILKGENPANNSEIQLTIAPGVRNYSGGGYTALEQVIEDVRLRPFPTITRANVLQPLEMKDTFYSPIIPAKYKEAGNYNLVSGHTRGNLVNGGLNRYPELAAAGMYTTAIDLCKFIIMMNRGGSYINSRNQNINILQNATVQDMLTSRARVGNTNLNQGLGFQLNRNANTSSNSFFYEHGGTNAGIKNIMRGYPNRNTGIVVLTNSNNGRGNAGNNFRGEILNAIRNIYNW